MAPEPCTIAVGHLATVLPAQLREYNRRCHGGPVLVGAWDLRFLVNCQHAFQGKTVVLRTQKAYNAPTPRCSLRRPSSPREAAHRGASSFCSSTDENANA